MISDLQASCPDTGIRSNHVWNYIYSFVDLHFCYYNVAAAVSQLLSQ